MQIASNHGYLWLNVTANNTVTRQMQSGTFSQTGLFSGDPKKMTLILVFWQGF
jgi:hypothetical protein